MRIHILSDLHAEHGGGPIPVAEADVLVLAGDISTGIRGIEMAAEVRASYREVVYVAGNHEYYGHALPRLDAKLRDRANQLGVRFLQNESVTIGGVRFLGATLWTDFEVGQPAVTRAAAVAAAESMMMDHRMIRVSPEFCRLRASDTMSAHGRSVRWLRGELSQDESTRTVVVSHHAPVPQSIGPQHARSDLNGAFASDLTSLIGDHRIDVWVHGHTHHCVNVMVGGTRVVSNQRGYPGEDTGAFDPSCVIELAK